MSGTRLAKPRVLQIVPLVHPERSLDTTLRTFAAFADHACMNEKRCVTPSATHTYPLCGYNSNTRQIALARRTHHY